MPCIASDARCIIKVAVTASYVIVWQRLRQAKIAKLGEEIDLAKAVVFLQLFDNSVFVVGGAGNTKLLPCHDNRGTYHVDGKLVLADG